ncbi:AraC family transcriptional activator of pobA [Chitinophaga sp. W2I13]|uniref:helix-turn-helix domain-containing protein n=1 Tax=Chitinophaga sp. W2I13 TaxID=3373923 RepID=UPI003D1F46B6
MGKKVKSIPVNPFAAALDPGVVVGKISSGNLLSYHAAHRPHRHDGHFFLLVEKGTAHIEIDLEKYHIKAFHVLYVHPNQVHRVVKSGKTDLYLLGITNENLTSQNLELLEQIVPAQPLSLTKSSFSIVSQAIWLCINIFERKQDKLYPSLLKGACNTLVALIVSQYLEQSASAGKLSRFDTITKAFKLLLERDFARVKRPSDYATALNISTPYLNECVRNATGFPVSYHIQQRIILEAKRLICHSGKSVKEIATELGYNDYAYFSRFFTKVTGMTAIAFRKKNLE